MRVNFNLEVVMPIISPPSVVDNRHEELLIGVLVCINLLIKKLVAI